MMGSLDPAKLLVILVVALIVLGPERLPRVARQLGSAWHELTRIRDQVTDEVRAAMPVDAIPHIPRMVPGSITGFVNSLTNSTARDASPDVEAAQASKQLLDAMDGLPATSPDVAGAPGGGLSGDGGAAEPLRRTAPQYLVHPNFGEFAFLPDDPSMN